MIKKYLLTLWPLTLPLTLLSVEKLLIPMHEWFPIYFPVALRDIPFTLLLLTLKSLFLLWLPYQLLAFLIHFFYRKSPSICGLTMFLGIYSTIVYLSFRQFPALSNLYPGWYLPFLLSLTIIFLFFSLRYLAILKKQTAIFLLITGIFLSTASLFKNSHLYPPTKTAVVQIETAPSFILISLDGVPGKYFYENLDFEFMPHWKNTWQSQSLSFLNTYTNTNSTFTSWMSILSGRDPRSNGISLLYPNNRLGNIDRSQFLPELLNQRGYNTVFLTDCAATAPMDNALGFQEVLQPTPGILSCAMELLKTQHALLPFISNFIPPAHENFCSYGYQSKNFTKFAEKKIQELESEEKPYFLAIHTCQTHRNVIEQLPNLDRIKQLAFPKHYSPTIKRFALSLREADEFIDKILSSSKQGRNRFEILLSDHGVREKFEGDQIHTLTHAWGPPLTRDQFNVPLSIHSNHGSLVGNFSDLVELRNLHRLILEIAKSPRATWGETQMRETLKTSFPFAILTSSLPIPHLSREFNAFAKRESHFDASGTLRFSSRLEEYLLEKASFSLVKLPYRLHFPNSGPVQLFDEIEDPKNLLDLATKEPEKTAELVAHACQAFPFSQCASSFFH